MNTQQLQLVTYEQAKRLKALGFDWKCDFFYNDFENLIENRMANNISQTYTDCCIAPTVPLALKWCRGVKNIICAVELYGKNNYQITAYDGDIMLFNRVMYRIYEAAESALLDELLNILEKEQ